MFAQIDKRIVSRMKYLEEIDKMDRNDGTQRLQRLRQIPPETGKFISILAANCPVDGEFIEIGTSAGYSTLWLSLTAKELGVKIKTFEVLPEKIKLAKDTFKVTGVENYVDLIEGDFLTYIDQINKISFCFLDAEKEIYLDCFKAIAARLIPNGLLIADNAINHYETIKPMIDLAMGDYRFDCLTVPIGKGEFICRRNNIK